MNFQGKNDKLA